MIAYVGCDLLGQITLLLLGPPAAPLSKIAVFGESFFSSLLMPMLTVYLLRCIGEDWRKSTLLTAVGLLWLVYFALLIVTQFTTVFYTVTPDNVYRRGPWYPVLLISPVLLMLLNLLALRRRRANLSRQQRLAFALYLLIPMGCMLVQMFSYGLLMIVFGSCVAAFCMFLFMLRDQQDHYVAQQREIANQRASILVLQMRPHFIFNTLMSIYSLCNLDPQKARQVTMDFTNYLRRNFNAVASENTIPFSAELEHTRAYLAVEQAQHEELLKKYPELCTSNLLCVYADVNGLHEVNNRQGHPAGDKMLREVAAAMQAIFGAEHTYRVGGDEFAAFRMDADSETAVAEIERMIQELAGKGYHVAFGMAVRERGQGPFDMQELVREAESAMFSAKREYYRQPEHNRRNR